VGVQRKFSTFTKKWSLYRKSSALLRKNLWCTGKGLHFYEKALGVQSKSSAVQKKFVSVRDFSPLHKERAIELIDATYLTPQLTQKLTQAQSEAFR
jgi:hypothetical protein